MKRWLHTFAFAIAAATAVGAGLYRANLHYVAGPLSVLAAIIVYVAWRFFYRPKPFTETRRYARALYFNGFISMDELQRFYDTHPEDENGNGK